MKSHSSKIKICFFVSLAASFLSTALFTPSFLFFFDIPIAYFSTAAVLPIIAQIFFTLNIIGAFSAFVLFPRNSLVCQQSLLSLPSRISSVIVFLSFFSYAFINLSIGKLEPISIVNAVLAILSAIFFLQNAYFGKKRNSMRAILAVPTILWATLSMIRAYSNVYVTMNSPVKIMLMLSMMSIMFYMLYEARFLAENPFPRAYAVSLITGICASSSFSIPFVALTLSKKYVISDFVPAAIVSLAFTAHLVCRAVDYFILSPAQPAETALSTAEEHHQ